MENPIITFDKKVDQVTIHRGEVITIWLNKCGRYEEMRSCTQVELRVKPDGSPEIFIVSDEIEVKKYSA